MRIIGQDLRYGMRGLLRNPGFTAVALLTLALGIGANSTIFSFVNGVLLRPLPYKESDRLVMLDETAPLRNTASMAVSFPNFLDWRAQNTVFTDISCFDDGAYTIVGLGDPERLSGASVSQGTFEMLGVEPLLGRNFTAEEDKPEQDTVVILGYGLWQRRFGGNPEAVGQTITVNGRARTIIGVMPRDFKFPEIAELWTPLALSTKSYTRTDHGLSSIARLKPGVTLGQAQAEMTVIASNIEAQNPVTNQGLGVNVFDLRNRLVSDYTQGAWILLGVVGVVLLIACTNVANLLLARSASRQKEIAIRVALGAGRWRIIRQLLCESLLLGAAGGLIGLMVAVWGRDLLLSAIPIKLPFWMQFNLDGRVLGFTIAVSVLTSVLFGAAPAFQASHTDLNEVLKEGGRGTIGVARRRLRQMLVIAEVALSLVLLIGAGLMMRSFQRLQRVNPGFDPDNVLTARLSLSPKYRGKSSAFFTQLLDRIKALPGVESAGAIVNVPLSGNRWGRSFTVEGRPILSVGEAPVVNHSVITPDYFKTMRIPILAGRAFNESDISSSEKVTIVDERLAREYWPDEDAVGKRVRFGPPEDNEPWHTIVGVAANVQHEELAATVRKTAYLPYPQSPVGSMSLVVRSTVAPESLSNAIKGQLKEIDPDLPLTLVATMNSVIAESVWQSRLYTILFGVFAGLALVLASVGVYGVMSYSVAQQTAEIGIRVALGARRMDVMRLTMGNGMILALSGIGVGLVVSLVVTRLLQGLLFEVTATDPVTHISMSLILTATALLACFIPARRATKVDPLVALRYE